MGVAKALKCLDMNSLKSLKRKIKNNRFLPNFFSSLEKALIYLNISPKAVQKAWTGLTSACIVTLSMCS
jgi:hypothetical protein